MRQAPRSGSAHRRHRATGLKVKEEESPKLFHWLVGPRLVQRIEASFTSPPNPKYFLLHTSHQIFRRMHGALNVDKKDN
jgi:hypothetical protein